VVIIAPDVNLWPTTIPNVLIGYLVIDPSNSRTVAGPNNKTLINIYSLSRVIKERS
jgi:hypothetical protein